jgi:uncharacterized protein (TIGR00251 family)
VSHASSPFTAAAGGLKVALRVTPKAGRNRIDGVAADAAGGAVLKVAVTAAPEGGKANAALIKLLAREWRLPKTTLAIVGGAAARRKLLHVSGEQAELMSRLERWLEARHD